MRRIDTARHIILAGHNKCWPTRRWCADGGGKCWIRRGKILRRYPSAAAVAAALPPSTCRGILAKCGDRYRPIGDAVKGDFHGCWRRRLRRGISWLAVIAGGHGAAAANDRRLEIVP